MAAVNNKITSQQSVDNTFDSNSSHPIENKLERISSIDRFRGIAVFCMIFFQFMSNFKSLGWFSIISSHNLEKGVLILPQMTIADIIAPMFMFAIGLTYVMSFKKRAEKYGKTKTYIHFALRYLAIIGLGTMMDIVNKIIDLFSGSQANPTDWIFITSFGVLFISFILYLISLLPKIKKFNKYAGLAVLYTLATTGVLTVLFSIYDFGVITADLSASKIGFWMVLQSIGFAGLVTLMFADLSLRKRLAWTIGILVAYSIYHQAGGGVLIGKFTQGGLFGGFGWATIIMFGTIVSELYNKNKKYFYIAIGALAIFAIIGGFAFEISKGSVSSGYVLVSLGISAVIYFIVDLFKFLKLKKFDFLAIWGKSPILMYILEFAFVGSLTQFLPSSMIHDAPVWLAIILVVVVTAILTIIGWLLSRKQKTVKL